MNVPISNLLNVFSSWSQFFGFVALVALVVFISAATIEALRGRWGKVLGLIVILIGIEWLCFGEAHGGITFS